MDRVADDDDDDDDDQESVSQSASTRPASSAEMGDDSRPSSAMSSVSHRGRKRKRSAALLAPHPKAGDFWSMVEQWFAARMRPDQFGKSLSSPSWVKYVRFTSILILYY